MDKSENFFVVSNYNTDPRNITKYARDYVVFDQSDNENIIKLINDLADSKIIRTKHRGHNLVDYFTFIVDNYKNLPNRIALVKGNIIGRHVTEDFWLKNYRNSWFTFFWTDLSFADKQDIAYALYSGKFIERNNSWYVPHASHRYFNNLNKFLGFFYEIEKFPEYNLFAPGACYILEKERILKNPVSFYKGLIKIMDYGFFPSEAWMVERSMSIFFDSDWQLRPFVFNEIDLIEKIDKLPDLSNSHQITKKRGKIRTSLIYRIEKFLKILKK